MSVCRFNPDWLSLGALLFDLIVSDSCIDSGLEWSQEDSSGMPLIGAMADVPTALSGLQTLIVSGRSKCEIPIAQIRRGGADALAVLQGMSFFKSSTSPETIFRQIDEDGSGFIDGVELRKFFKSNSTLDSSCRSFAQEFNGELEQMFIHLDQDGSGEITIEEWQRGFTGSPGGPWHEEILIMGELLRRDRQATEMSEAAKKAGERIVKFLEEINARAPPVTRIVWEQRVKNFMVEGHVRIRATCQSNSSHVVLVK